LREVFPGRAVVLARELTKKFEEYLRGTPEELLELAPENPAVEGGICGIGGGRG